MTKISERTLLVQLNISQWTARKLDKQETDALTRAHGADVKAARVNKSLLPTAMSLDQVAQKTGAIRTDYYFRTLPWAMDGARIIRSDAYMDFAVVMRDHLNEWDQLVAKFLAEYPRLQQDAQRALGSLYKPDDYPSTWELRQKFTAGVNFLPVPNAADWRVEGIDEDMEQLRRQVADQVTEGLATAAKDAWERVRAVVAKAHERLSKPDAVFRDTLVENARDLCKILPSLNINNDPKLEEVRRELERSLCAVHPEDLRQSPALRSSVAGAMDDVLRKMGAFYQQAA